MGSCSAGAVMLGGSTVLCDGEAWMGSKPQCLVAPHPPSLSVIIEGVEVENPAVAVGQEVTLACHSLGGNPAPSVAFYLDGEQGGEEGLRGKEQCPGAPCVLSLPSTGYQVCSSSHLYQGGDSCPSWGPCTVHLHLCCG